MSSETDNKKEKPRRRGILKVDGLTGSERAQLARAISELQNQFRRYNIHLTVTI